VLLSISPSQNHSIIIILQMVTLKAFDKFESTTDALSSATHLVDSKLPKGLRKFLKAECAGETLVVADSKLGKAISDKLVCWGFLVFSSHISFSLSQFLQNLICIFTPLYDEGWSASPGNI
jgi:hypothetical protein